MKKIILAAVILINSLAAIGQGSSSPTCVQNPCGWNVCGRAPLNVYDPYLASLDSFLYNGGVPINAHISTDTIEGVFVANDTSTHKLIDTLIKRMTNPVNAITKNNSIFLYQDANSITQSVFKDATLSSAFINGVDSSVFKDLNGRSAFIDGSGNSMFGSAGVSYGYTGNNLLTSINTQLTDVTTGSAFATAADSSVFKDMNGRSAFIDGAGLSYFSDVTGSPFTTIADSSVFKTASGQSAFVCGNGQSAFYNQNGQSYLSEIYLGQRNMLGDIDGSAFTTQAADSSVFKDLNGRSVFVDKNGYSALIDNTTLPGASYLAEIALGFNYGIFDTAGNRTPFTGAPAYLLEIRDTINTIGDNVSNTLKNTDSLVKFQTNGYATQYTMTITATDTTYTGSLIVGGIDTAGNTITALDLSNETNIEAYLLKSGGIPPGNVPLETFKMLATAHRVKALHGCTIFILKLN